MNVACANPRSALHALEPFGLGTPEVESLQSYFCRLAVSHSVSISAMSREVAQMAGLELSDRHEWHRGCLNGLGETARNWSSALSGLTSIERLDRLTLMPWQDVVSTSGLMSKRGRWCPHCFDEDRAAGRSPYFRLAWELGVVSVCAKHKVELIHTCPGCGRPDARHKSAYVVPGWCAHCGEYLGKADSTVVSAPEELWKAMQVGLMLSAQASLNSNPTKDGLHGVIGELVTKLDSGAYSKQTGQPFHAKLDTHSTPNWTVGA